MTIYCVFRLRLLLLIAGVLNLGCQFVESTDHQKHNVDLFQSAPSDSLPALFGPGFISTDLSERDAALSPQGDVFYFTVWTGAFGAIAATHQTAEGWTEPELVPFSGIYSDLEPCITIDGMRMYFASNRPLNGQGEAKDYDIWYVDRIEDGWSEPVNIGAPVNTEKNEFYPSMTADGILVVTARYEGSLGGEDLFFVKSGDGVFLQPQNPGPAINSPRDEFNSFIAADGQMILFSSFGREDGLGGGDLYISFRDENGDWQPAKNLGESINSTSLDYCPSISPDGKWLFFTSQRRALQPDNNGKFTYAELVRKLNGPQNGFGDLYWLNSTILQNFK